MDYPQLNLIFGLLLMLTLVVNIGLCVLLSKANVSVGLSRLSWLALIVSILSTLYIEVLFLRFMTPAFNAQIGFGLLLGASLGALVTVSWYRQSGPQLSATVLLSLQIFAGLMSVLLAYGLYRSLVPL